MRPFWLASIRTVIALAGVVVAAPPAVVDVALTPPAAVVGLPARLVEVEAATGEGPAVVELPGVEDVVVDDALPALPLPPQAAVRSPTVANPRRAPRPIRLVPELTGRTLTDTVPAMDLEALQALELTGADGGAHRLEDLWSHRPVILVFLRHFG
ncbi:MAG TPA: hypothetical protein VFH50_15340 [Acidimicrobiales bacterium]|nr:hypothetical protein [Acidimicrobiales bacterium]